MFSDLIFTTMHQEPTAKVVIDTKYYNQLSLFSLRSCAPLAAEHLRFNYGCPLR